MARRARHDLPEVQDKRARVVELRGQGLTFDQIAAQVGYSDASAASKAWHQAIRQRADLTVDDVRAQEKTRLEQMDSRLSDIIVRPPVRTTSIGRTQWDVRTCTCDVRADTKREHDPGCQVQPVLDEHAVIAAIKERRMIGESLRRLTGADAAPAGGLLDDYQVRRMAEVLIAQRDLARQAPQPALQLPPGYATMTPAQQADAHIAAVRKAKEQQEAAITAATTPQPGDNDITDAEIVDEED